MKPSGLTKHITFENITFALLLFIVGAAFTLSFRTVQASGNVFFPQYGWLFAGLIDAGMVVIGLIRVQAGVMRSKGLKNAAYGGLAVSLVLSVLLNVVNHDGTFKSDWLHYVVHGLPPVALLALTELALSMYDERVANGGNSLDALKQELASVRHELAGTCRERDDLRQNLDAAMAKSDNVKQERDEIAAMFAELQKEFDNLQRKIGTQYVRIDELPERAAYVVAQLAKGKLPNGDMAEKFGMGASSVDKLMTALVPAGERERFVS